MARRRSSPRSRCRYYIDYKEGRAKKNFIEALAKAKLKAEGGKEEKLPEEIKKTLIDRVLAKEPNAKMIVAPVSGTVIWELAVEEKSMPKAIGTRVKEGETICFIAAYYGNEEVQSLYDGRILEIIAKQGDKVQKGDLIAFVL